VEVRETRLRAQAIIPSMIKPPEVESESDRLRRETVVVIP
jgi:hypothetical protein